MSLITTRAWCARRASRGCRATTPSSRSTTARSSSPPRSRPSHRTSGTSNRWSAPRSASSPRSGLAIPTSCSPTPAYWHQRQMQQIASEGIQVLVPPDAGLRRGARSGWTGGMYSFMRRVLATPHGHDVYPPTPDHDRARLRPDQFQPRDQTLPTPRQNRLPQRMGAHRRDPQPAEAPQPPPRRRDTMIATAAAPPAAPPRSPPRRRIRAVAGLTRHQSTRR